MNATKQIRFPSDIGEYRDLYLKDYGPDDIAIEYEGNKYFVGSLAQTESDYPVRMFTKSKVNLETKLLTLTALAKANPHEAIKLITNVPISSHKPEEKQAIKKEFIGKHRICLNGTWRELFISHVEVGAEGGLAHWSAPKPKDGLQRYVDFGSATLNVATLLDGNYIEKDSFTEDLGVEFKRNFNAERMSSVVISVLSRLNEADGITLIGGAAKQFYDPLYDHFGNVELHHNPIMANALGGFRVGQMIW